MSEYSLIQGVLHVPHFTFFRCAGVCSAAYLLRALGLEGYRPTTGGDFVVGRPSLFLAEDDAWIHLMDDWSYTLWHSPEFRKQVSDFAAGCDVFSFWVGDADQSYGFSAWRGGELVRRRVVDSPNYTDQIMAEDAGSPLPGEARVLAEWEEGEGGIITMLHALARAQGIDLVHEGRPITCYAYSAPGGQVRPMRRA